MLRPRKPKPPQPQPPTHLVELRVDRYQMAEAVCLQCGAASAMAQVGSPAQMTLLDLWVNNHKWLVAAPVVRLPDVQRHEDGYTGA